MTPLPPDADHLPTPEDVAQHPAYWISGPGHDRAHAVSCGHGYRLTDSCPAC